MTWSSSKIIRLLSCFRRFIIYYLFGFCRLFSGRSRTAEKTSVVMRYEAGSWDPTERREPSFFFFCGCLMADKQQFNDSLTALNCSSLFGEVLARCLIGRWALVRFKDVKGHPDCGNIHLVYILMLCDPGRLFTSLISHPRQLDFPHGDH